MEKLTCNQAKVLPMVDYLATIGIRPHLIRGNDHWYISPFRDERTPSFKIDRKLNLWYDHGEGKGGNLIDFGTRYFKCSVADLLNRLTTYKLNFSFQPPSHPGQLATAPPALAGEKKDPAASKIVVLSDRQLSAPPLIDYLESRHIPLEIARKYCREVDFLLYGRQHTVIGFRNDAGGYELRSADFKGSSSPKGITFFDHGQKEVAVFEGFFNYLSFRAMDGKATTNILVLNSLSFFDRSRQIMDRHHQVKLYLDRDKSGIRCTRQAIKWDDKKYIDQSQLYHPYKDLNDWILHYKHEKNHSHELGAPALRLG